MPPFSPAFPTCGIWKTTTKCSIIEALTKTNSENYAVPIWRHNGYFIPILLACTIYETSLINLWRFMQFIMNKILMELCPISQHYFIVSRLEIASNFISSICYVLIKIRFNVSYESWVVRINLEMCTCKVCPKVSFWTKEWNKTLWKFKKAGATIGIGGGGILKYSIIPNSS
jgi:hypothetical protein